MGIGIHKNKDFGYYKADVWVFPCRDITHTDRDRVIGFEYRRSNWKPFRSENKCIKQKGTVSKLVQVNSRKKDMNNCIVLEGFIDAYCYYQFAHDKGNTDKLHILTPSCGVNSLVNNVEKFDFGSYEKVTFLLDTDKAGLEATHKLNELYPDFNYNVSLPKPFTDFGEWYLENKASLT
jgi:DNA primase